MAESDKGAESTVMYVHSWARDGARRGGGGGGGGVRESERERGGGKERGWLAFMSNVCCLSSCFLPLLRRSVQTTGAGGKKNTRIELH